MPRFGDRLENFLKVQDEQLQALARAANGHVDPVWQSQAARDLIRELNELGGRDDTYSSWLQPGSNQPKFDKPTIRTVDWIGSPLSQATFEVQTDLAVLNNTKTFLTFDTFYGSDNFFYIDPADASKIRFRTPMQSFMVSGILNWNNHATGYRTIALEGFDADDNTLGFIGLNLLQGTATEDNSMPVSYVTNFSALPSMKYIKFYVRQTSGTTLTMFYCLLSLFVV